MSFGVTQRKVVELGFDESGLALSETSVLRVKNGRVQMSLGASDWESRLQ